MKNSDKMWVGGLMAAVTAVASATVEARDYSGMIHASASGEFRMAATWGGTAPQGSADYYSNGKSLQGPGFHNGTVERFGGNALYLDSQLIFADESSVESYPVYFGGDGLFLDSGADLSMWKRTAHLSGKMTVANDDTDRLVNVHGLGDGTGKSFCFLGELAGGSSSGLLVGYNPGQYGVMKDGVYRYSGLIVFEFKGSAEAYYGRLATESGGVIRASASLPNASVVLGLMPSGNARTFPSLFDYAQSLNGVFEAVPGSGTSLAVGSLTSNGGTVKVDTGVTLSVGDLALNGGRLVLTGAGSVGSESFPSISVSGSYSVSSAPVKLFIGDVAPASGATLITVPPGGGSLRAEDFEIVDLSGKAAALAGAVPLAVSVDPATGVQRLRYGGGFVYKTENDNDGSHAHVNKAWSDGSQQHSGALYYNNGMNLYLNSPRGNFTFDDGETRRALQWRGDGLVIDGSPDIMVYGWPSDAISVGGAGMVLFDSPHFRTWWEHAAIDGTLVVKTDDVCIESTVRADISWDIPAKLVGDSSARIRFQHQSGLEANENYSGRIYTCNAYGNVDDWHGGFHVATNHILNAQAGFPHGTVSLAPGATLRSTTNKTPSYAEIVSSGVVELKAGDSWTVGSLSVDGGVIRVSGDSAAAGTALMSVSGAVSVSGGKVRVALERRPQSSPALVLEVPSDCALATEAFAVECEDGFPSDRVEVRISEPAAGRRAYSVCRKALGLNVIIR